MHAALRPLPLVLLAAFGLTACSGSTAPETPCRAGTTMCFGQGSQLLVCSEDGTAWEGSICDTGLLCHEGSCQALSCIPGSRTCEGDAVVACSADGAGRLYPEPCPDGDTCFEGACAPRLCQPGAFRCADGGGTERCEDNGTRWAPAGTCAETETCSGGACLPGSCATGETYCGPTSLYTCNASDAWTATPCPEDQPCLFGACVSCVANESCGEGEVCEEGTCVATAPQLLTDTLPAGTVGGIYAATLEVTGGLAPYEWTVTEGALPAGLGLDAFGGITGVATAAGTAAFTVTVQDSAAKTDARSYTLEIAPEGGPLSVATASLPTAEHGLDYSTALQATGGEPPYAWQVLEGALPQGLALGSMGRIEGIPDEIGTFPVTVRVLDGLTPPAYATRDLSLTVEIAPLTIIGEDEYNLLFTKIIVLPTLIEYIPYSAQLTARGGLRPYAWSEQPPPTGLDFVIPTWGLPDGLSIGADGKLSGWVTDISDATTITIPFTSYSLTGYFIYVKVTDTQNPAVSAEAVFCLPTVPIG